MRSLLPLLLILTTTLSAGLPNIVLILADDMGYGDIGIHGCTDIPTPHIDRIAKEGVRFTNAYANASFCTPTRAALMSCRYQQRSGNDDLPQVTGPLPLQVKTLSDRLQESGYLTGMVGKWHLGEGKGYHPLERGFDEFFGFLGGGHIYNPNPKGYTGGYNAPILRQNEPVPEPRYLTDAFGGEAAAFLKRHRNTEKPLFLYLAFNAVHTPMEATEKYLSRFPDLSGRRKIYAAMLSAMDDAIGEVLVELDESGKAKDTVVIFHNDNGGPTTRNAINGSTNTPLRGSKCETFEGGIRVPQALRWPGVIEPGTTYEKPCITFDLSATALALAKADTCSVEGVNLMPYLSGEKEGPPHETLYWRCRTRNNNYGVRHGDWKFVHSTEGTKQPGPKQTPARDYLFNLAEDIGEQNDLSEKHPEILQKLKDLFWEWDKDVDAECEALGVKVPAIRKPREAQPTLTSAVTKFEPTEAFPGLDKLVNIQARESKLGFDLTSDDNGLALVKLATPIKGRKKLNCIIQPPKAFPSNGFLAIGQEPTDAGTTKLGLLVGGNQASIIQGPYGSKSGTSTPAQLQGGKMYDAEVLVDVPAKKITFKIAGATQTYPLKEGTEEIRYVGYYIIRTRAQFGKILILDDEPR